MKSRTITTIDELDQLEQQITRSVEAAASSLKTILESDDALGAFAKLKFTETGLDPLDTTRSLNIVEQLNQTFTYLASVAGARWLMLRHPECTPLTLNLGTASGFDIESISGRFVAETFAATHPDSNDKLRKDILKVQGADAHRFVFYLSPVAAPQLDVPGVSVVRLEHPILAILSSSQGVRLSAR